MPHPRWRRSGISVPDQIAILRIGLVPVVMVLVVWDGLDHHFGIAASVFAVAAITDYLDGFLARRWKITTVFGGFLDSVADKLLATGVLLVLIEVGRVWVWAAFIIIGRELIVMGLRGLAALDGTTVPPSIWGKIKTAVQFSAMGLAMLRLPDEWGPFFLDEWLILVAVAVTVLSAVGYFANFGRVLKSA